MQISVILPTYNRVASLQRVIQGLEQQTFPKDEYEVIVVSDGSTDHTNQYLGALQTTFHFKTIYQENLGVAAARNSGIFEASSDLVLFIDDDVVPVPGLIEEHLSVHNQDDGHVVVIGPMLTPSDHQMSPWVRWGQERLVEQYDAMLAGEWEATARQFYTGNCSLARQSLIASGGFDPAFRRAEDVELAYRLANDGMSFIFNPNAIGYHYEERSFQSWIEIPASYGKNDVIFAMEKDQSWLLPTIFREYPSRHAFTRALTWLCLDRIWLQKFVIKIFKPIALIGNLLEWSQLTRLACSSIFNLIYYQAITDGLGGREHFFRGVESKHSQSGISRKGETTNLDTAS